jgi:hypothetical protein
MKLSARNQIKGKIVDVVKGATTSIEFLAQNVAGKTRGGLANVSIEQVLVWDPEIIVAIEREFASKVYDDPAWATIAAVRARRVHPSPGLPFGWVDFPPSVSRLIGLWWLAKILYPDLFPEDLRQPPARSIKRSITCRSRISRSIACWRDGIDRPPPEQVKGCGRGISFSSSVPAPRQAHAPDRSSRFFRYTVAGTLGGRRSPRAAFVRTTILEFRSGAP